MKQIARDLTDAVGDFMNGMRYVLMDRDGKFCPAFREFLKDETIEPVVLPVESPSMIFFGANSLRKAVSSLLVHCHAERNHQGLGNRLIQPGAEAGRRDGDVVCRERLGGLLRYYYRKAA
jgi:hypothetical protein